MNGLTINLNDIKFNETCSVIKEMIVNDDSISNRFVINFDLYIQ